MAFPETTGDPEDIRIAAQRTAAAEQPVVDETTRRLAALVEDKFLIYSTEVVQMQTRNNTPRAVIFQGKLLEDSEPTYPILVERFKPLGYTPMLRRKNNVDMLLVFEGLLQGRRFSSPAWLHVMLLVITIVTTTISGAQFQGIGLDRFLFAISRGDWSDVGWILGLGAPFALTLLLILGVHEMGHYLAARRHGVDVTLPYFIPFPFFLLGTLGAVIFIKSPLNNRKALFDVGISGPLAGFVVALIAFIIGLSLPQTERNYLLQEIGGRVRGENIGMPILLQTLGDTLYPNLAEAKGVRSLSVFVARQPIAFAAWFGMLLTVLNLLPIGQLDGGHVMYTLFGQWAWYIALGAFGTLIFLGMTVFPSLIFFAFLALMTGLRHPPPGDDITPLNRGRRWLGYATIVLFFLIGTATPFVFR